MSPFIVPYTATLGMELELLVKPVVVCHHSLLCRLNDVMAGSMSIVSNDKISLFTSIKGSRNKVDLGFHVLDFTEGLYQQISE